MEYDETQEYIRIAILESAVEAQLVTSILEERDIPHIVRSFHDTAYDGLFQVQKGWGEITGPSTSKADIMEIIEAVRKAPPEPE